MPSAINALAVFLIIALGAMSIFFLVCAIFAEYDIRARKKNGITKSLRDTGVSTFVFFAFLSADFWLIIGSPPLTVTLTLLTCTAMSVLLLAVTYIQLVYYVATTDE